MAIITQVDPRTKKPFIMVEGKVEQISFKDISPADKFGNTHRAGVRIGDDWVNGISIKTKEGYDPAVRFKSGDDWINLEVGDVVTIEVTESEYNGKIYYNAGVSKISLLQKGEGGKAKATASGGSVKEPYKPKDMTGVSVGHSLNGAVLLGATDNIDIIEAAKQIHVITEKLKAEYAQKYPDMSAYDVGASVGNSVLNACRLAENVDDIEEFATDLLDNVVPEIMSFVKGQGKKEDKKPAAKKTSAKKTAPKTEKAEPQLSDDDQFTGSGGFEDMDDQDIPF